MLRELIEVPFAGAPTHPAGCPAGVVLHNELAWQRILEGLAHDPLPRIC